MSDRPITRRTYLIGKAMSGGVPMFLATEAASELAFEHPEWDMDERRTWQEWEAEDRPR